MPDQSLAQLIIAMRQRVDTCLRSETMDRQLALEDLDTLLMQAEGKLGIKTRPGRV